jgi:predicted transposase/invertase (TIGR01784 family)
MTRSGSVDDAGAPAASERPAHPHDAFFKDTIGDPAMADRFLREHLPEAILRLLGPEPPELQPGSFIDQELHEHHTDLLYRLRLRDGSELLAYFVIEHKSASDPWARLQLLRYVIRVLTRLSKDPERHLPLPPVVQILVHHGPSGWTSSKEFQDLFGDAPVELLRFLPACEHVVIDLIRTPDEDLSSDLRLRVRLKALKYVLHPDLPALLDLILAEAALLDPMEFALVVRYLVVGSRRIGETMLRESLRRVVPERAEELMTTWLQRYIDEGMAKGFEQGMQQGMQQGRAEGEARGEAKAVIRVAEKRFGPLPTLLKERILSADAATIEAWLDRVAEAPSLKAVFDTVH